jgi:hypothetical protein
MTERMRAWLEDRGMDSSRIFDLGLDALEDQVDTRPTKLVEMMPRELAALLMGRLEALGISIKSMPSDNDIRQDIREKVEQLLLGHLWEGVSQQLEVTQLLDDIDQQLCLTESMLKQATDEQIKQSLVQASCTDSYAAVLDNVVDEFFESFMREHSAHLQELAQDHLTHMQGEWK